MMISGPFGIVPFPEVGKMQVDHEVAKLADIQKDAANAFDSDDTDPIHQTYQKVDGMLEDLIKAHVHERKRMSGAVSQILTYVNEGSFADPFGDGKRAIGTREERQLLQKLPLTALLSFRLLAIPPASYASKQLAMLAM